MRGARMKRGKEDNSVQEEVMVGEIKLFLFFGVRCLWFALLCCISFPQGIGDGTWVRGCGGVLAFYFGRWHHERREW